MISLFEKDTSLKPEALRAWDLKSQVWNVLDQRTAWIFLSWNLSVKQGERTKETLSCENVYFILHPALKHSCCWHCAAQLDAGCAIIKCEWAFIPSTSCN